MIRIEGIAKKFGGRPALHPLSFEVRRGEIFGLLGHNGAGKSTTIGILLGQIYPDSGQASIGGCNVHQDRHGALSRLGALFEAPAFYNELSGWTNLRILTAYSRPLPRKQLEATVEMVGLSGRIGDRVSRYSHGMRQRLALAQALLPLPEVLILDEPTEGLDPEGIHEIRNLILRLNREHGMTIVLCSHLLTEVEHLCPRLVILREGRRAFYGQWREGGVRRVRLATDRTDDSLALLQRQGLLTELFPGGEALLSAAANIPEIASYLVQAGHRIEAIGRVENRLEEVYLRALQDVKEESSA